MKFLCALLLAGFAFLGSGCALFSSFEQGPLNINGSTLEEVVQSAGAPDVIGGSGSHLVLGWRRVEGMSILGLFASTNEKTHAAVFDSRGNALGISNGRDNGKGLAILGVINPYSPNASTR